MTQVQLPNLWSISLSEPESESEWNPELNPVTVTSHKLIKSSLIVVIVPESRLWITTWNQVPLLYFSIHPPIWLIWHNQIEVKDAATVSWFNDSGDKMVIRHPLNQRKQTSVRKAYVRKITAHGIMDGCRSQPWLVQHLGFQKMVPEVSVSNYQMTWLLDC